MKSWKYLAAGLLAAALLAGPWIGRAAEDKNAVKPYPLKTCVVSGEALDSMGSAYVFTNKNREIKLCCKGCLKDFQKNPAKYINKLEEAEKKNAK